jgi:hypothetical protein
MELTIKSPKYGIFNYIIDDEDCDKIKDYTWQVRKNHNYNVFYIGSKIKQKNNIYKNIELSRLITGAKCTELVDHKNGDTLDNTKSNLRVCSRAENNRNSNKRKDGNTSNYKGVCWKARNNKFVSQINFNNKKIHLGYFETEDQAAIAYNMAAIKYFGEFARPNNNIMMHKGI